MPKLPESHERDYLELLKPFTSEEQIKTRRNVVVTSFVVLSIYFLGRSLTDISVFGVNLKDSNDVFVLALTAILIAYWLIIYLIYFRRDFEIQKEQERLLLSHVKKVKDRIDESQSNLEKLGDDIGGMRPHWATELNNAKTYYSIYENQLNRTKSAGTLNVVLKKVEIWLPVIVSTAALLLMILEAVKLSNK